jgi:hypothetical protein
MMLPTLMCYVEDTCYNKTPKETSNKPITTQSEIKEQRTRLDLHQTQIPLQSLLKAFRLTPQEHELLSSLLMPNFVPTNLY